MRIKLLDGFGYMSNALFAISGKSSASVTASTLNCFIPIHACVKLNTCSGVPSTR